MKLATWTKPVALTALWATTAMVLSSGIYSISRIGVAPINMVMAGLGAGQIILALKWPRAAYRVAAAELFLGQLLLFGYFFTPHESNTPELEVLSLSWKVGIYYFAMTASLVLAKI